jgi:hypothetical protein
MRRFLSLNEKRELRGGKGVYNRRSQRLRERASSRPTARKKKRHGVESKVGRAKLGWVSDVREGPQRLPGRACASQKITLGLACHTLSVFFWRLLSLFLFFFFFFFFLVVVVRLSIRAGYLLSPPNDALRMSTRI